LTIALFAARAALQIDRIYNHIASDNPAAARDVVDRIYKVADFLSTYPNSGRKTVFKDVRMFAVTPYPYVVFFRYVPKRGQIRILDVRHSARRRPALQEHAMEFRR
jgi:toxin ParE1/3/4